MFRAGAVEPIVSRFGGEQTGMGAERVHVPFGMRRGDAACCQIPLDHC